MSDIESILNQLLFHVRPIKIPRNQFDELFLRIYPESAPISTCDELRLGLAIALRYILYADDLNKMDIPEKYHELRTMINVQNILNHIYDVLQPTYLSMPKSADTWLLISYYFERIWRVPHVLGVVQHYNWKDLHFLTVHDAHCRFLYYTEYSGTPTEVFKDLRTAIEAANIPAPTPFEGAVLPVPYFFVSNETYPMDEYVMVPFHPQPEPDSVHVQENFKSKLYYVVDSSDRAYGNLAMRFEILNKPYPTYSRRNQSAITRACMVLHNYLDVPNLADDLSFGKTCPLDLIRVYSGNVTPTDVAKQMQIRVAVSLYNHDPNFDPLD